MKGTFSQIFMSILSTSQSFAQEIFTKQKLKIITTNRKVSITRINAQALLTTR